MGTIIEKGQAGFGLLANILIQKYDDHLPLYRQSEILERAGIEISRSTMTGGIVSMYCAASKYVVFNFFSNRT